MENCKSIVSTAFECYFFISRSCIVMYVSSIDDVSLKRVNKRIILSRRKNGPLANFQVHCSHCLPVLK